CDALDCGDPPSRGASRSPSPERGGMGRGQRHVSETRCDPLLSSPFQGEGRLAIVASTELRRRGRADKMPPQPHPGIFMARFGFGGTGDERGPRLDAIDAIRGAALCAMVVYHFAWDLADFHLVGWDVAAGPIWRLFARSIASSFLILVGVSLVL